MSTATRRSTRRAAAAAASVEPAPSAPERSASQETPPPEPSKKRGRKPKAASAKVESQTVTEQTVTKARATSRANPTPPTTATKKSTTTTTTTTSATVTTTPAPVVAKRTRAGRAKLVEAGGEASPQRSLDVTRSTKRIRGASQQKAAFEKRKSASSTAASVNDENEDEDDDDDEGLFFKKRKLRFRSSPIAEETAPSDIETDAQESRAVHTEVDLLRVRVTDLEALNQNLTELFLEKDKHLFEYENENLRLKNQVMHLHEEIARLQGNSRLRSPLNLSYGTPANIYVSEFDNELVGVTESPPAQPVFVNGTESALALLHKIENAAKETVRVEPPNRESETHPDEVTEPSLQQSPQQSVPQSAKRSFTEASVTPDRPVATPSNIFSRSFSAIKSRLFSSTPKPPSPPKIPSPPTAKPLPPPDTFTEILSTPPTPIGERINKTPSKRRTPTNSMMKVLLKGIEPGDKRKAEEWAKQVIPELKNDPNYSEKRTRLQSTVLFQDLTHFPSSKPWETGFGDPLGDLDDEDSVPAWAIYLDMKAEEEEHKPKRSKKSHRSSMDSEDILTIDEQYAASNSARTPPKLYNSHGQSASLYDFRPRRAIDPSPLFSNSVSHNEGGNLFRELHGHDSATQTRENDREILKNAAKSPVKVKTPPHNPVAGSFSASFDYSDDEEEDSNADSETSEAEAAPIWTQPPPPAPVPAHAPLPGGPSTEAPSAPVADVPPTPTGQQPVAEIERQRQRLMKHTPAKPSRLREATYPSPSLFSDAGNESILAATPAHIADSVASMFADMPAAQPIELDEEEQADFDALVQTDAFKQQLASNDWPAATLTYESDEEELSPTSV
ncbi:hypothetical protein HRS9139_02895 [Pyrenophora teres f. teres]|nr:hypothetical protein HRS9139_02895 [Pyrenophora teres f. teres]